MSKKAKELLIPTATVGEQVRVAIEYGDKFGGMPGIEISVEQSDSSKEETRLPTRSEMRSILKAATQFFEEHLTD